MLKDSLEELIKTQKNSKLRSCKIGKIICNHDNETQRLLIKTLQDEEVRTISIVRLLKSEGLPVSREFLGAKRNECFTVEEIPRECCISEKLEAFKNDKQ
jgi:hypothetical protein